MSVMRTGKIVINLFKLQGAAVFQLVMRPFFWRALLLNSDFEMVVITEKGTGLEGLCRNLLRIWSGTRVTHRCKLLPVEISSRE
jgi:hypothetical protein